jgi:hypothetical protein
MMRLPDDRPPLDREEARFIEYLASHYTPPPMSAAKRVALDAALWARLRGRSRRIRWVPALATVAVVGIVVWFVMIGRVTQLPKGGREPGDGRIAVPRIVPWEYEFIFPPQPSAGDAQDENPVLPDDYVAIAQVFLDR